MRVCRDGSKREGVNITIDGQIVEEVNQFRYLGSLISYDMICTAEIKRIVLYGLETWTLRKYERYRL